MAEVTLEEWDMSNSARIAELFDKHRPAEAYNCAAKSSGVGMYDDPAGMARSTASR